MPFTRVVAILGRGSRNPTPPPAYTYEPVVYELQTPNSRFRTTRPTRFPVVLHLDRARRNGGEAELVLLATPEARQNWLDGGQSLQRELAACGHGDVPVHVLDLRNSELDEFPRTFLDQFHAALAAPRGGVQPDLIVVDPTHGLRSMSLLATAAIEAFVDQQLHANQPPGIEIYYAAFEARQQDVAPIWDLTTIVFQHLWLSAVDEFLTHGRADRFASLCKAAGDRSGRDGQHEQAGRLRRLAGAALGLADALATARLARLVEQAASQFCSAAEAAQPLLEQQSPMLTAPLRRLIQRAASCRAERLLSRDGLRAAVGVARFALECQRYAECSAILRETAITAHALRHPPAERLDPPQNQPYEAWRNRQEEAIRATGREYRTTASTPEPWAKLFDDYTELRNDVQHAGYRSTPLDSPAIREQLRCFLARAEQLLEPNPSPMAIPLIPNTDSLEAALARWEAAPPTERDAIYREQVFPFAAQRIRATRAEQGPVQLLVIPVGTQPYAPLLAALATPARHVALLATSRSQTLADEVAATLATLPAAECPAVQTFPIGDANSGIAVAQAVDAALFWAGDPWPADVVLDVTGGRKATSAALGALAGLRGFRQVYIESQERTLPGGAKLFTDEVLRTLDDVRAWLGEDRRAAARALFAAGAFAAAQAELDQIAEHLLARPALGWLSAFTAAALESDPTTARQRFAALAQELPTAPLRDALAAPSQNGTATAADAARFLQALEEEGAWR